MLTQQLQAVQDIEITSVDFVVLSTSSHVCIFPNPICTVDHICN